VKNAGRRTSAAWLALGAATLIGGAAPAAAQLPLPTGSTTGLLQTTTQTAGSLPVVGGVITGATGTVGGIVSGAQDTVTGTVGQVVGGVLDTAGSALPGGTGGDGAAGGSGGTGASSGQLPAGTVDSLLQILLSASPASGNGNVVIDDVPPSARVKVLSRISQIAHTSSLRLEISSDEAGVVAVGGALRPGYATKGHAKGHSRRLVKWPAAVLGFRGPGKLQVTIKLSRKARINLAHSRNARVGIATVAADLRRNQKADYFKLAVKR
jgi:hypothetical protein